MAQLAPTFAAIKSFVAPVVAAAKTAAPYVATAGTVLSTAGAISAAKDQRAMGEYQAQLADKQAEEKRAISIKNAREQRRRGRMMVSEARARGAASGGGLDLDLMGDIAGEAELNALNAIWEGETGAASSSAAANEARFEGSTREKAGFIDAGNTLLGGTASLLDKYG